MTQMVEVSRAYFIGHFMLFAGLFMGLLPGFALGYLYSTWLEYKKGK